MIRKFIFGLVLVLFVQVAEGADLVRFVRLKISAGDLATGLAMAEDSRKAPGVDEEYLNAMGWSARGAEMLGRPEVARV